MALAKHPWRHGGGIGKQAAPRGLCLHLQRLVGAAVPAKGRRPGLAPPNHPSRNVFTAQVKTGHGPAITVTAARRHPHRAARHMLRQGATCRDTTGLADLRRVHAVEPDLDRRTATRRRHPDRVAIRDMSDFSGPSPDWTGASSYQNNSKNKPDPGHGLSPSPGAGEHPGAGRPWATRCGPAPCGRHAAARHPAPGPAARPRTWTAPPAGRG
jgi:hypothetical protein